MPKRPAHPPTAVSVLAARRDLVIVLTVDAYDTCVVVDIVYWYPFTRYGVPETWVSPGRGE